jgi:hypothetical protein
VLIFQDEMESHRYPALTRMWAPVGQQPHVPTPGKNEKQVVYGGIDYKTGQLTYTRDSRQRLKSTGPAGYEQSCENDS